MIPLDRFELDPLLDDQSFQWRLGRRVPVEKYLEHEPTLTDDAEAVLDLIYHEVILRRRCGEVPLLEETVGPPWQIFKARDVRGVRPLGEGRQLALADHGIGKLVLFDPDDAGKRFDLGDHAGISQIAVSPDGRWVATASAHGVGSSAQVWDLRSHTLAWQMPGDVDWGNANIIFSPDGRWLVTGTTRKYQFWESGTWKPAMSIERDHAGFSLGTFAFTKDAKILAINGSSHLVRLIEVKTGRQLASFEAPDPRTISQLAFSPDESLLAVGCEGPAIQLWNLSYVRQQLCSIGLDWEQDSLPRAHELALKPFLSRVIGASSARN